MHSRYLAQHFDVEIIPQPNYGIAYNEPRHQSRDKSLEESFVDALKRWSKSVDSKTHFFFIEDTSVVIPALSEGDLEVPGLDIKYWMQGMDFPTLDHLLTQVNRGRDAIVRSDVVLYLPPVLQQREADHLQYKRFTHFTKGSITTKEVRVVTNHLYPWLDNVSFNKWFVPDGEVNVLSKLPIQRADRYDIRKGSIGDMLQFLESKHIIKVRSKQKAWAKESLLPMGWPKLLLVCGLPCSGKTTIGTFLALQCNYFHIEASDFMRLAYEKRNSTEAPLSLDSFAAAALKANPGIVVDEVLKELGRANEEWPVITGFRDVKEVALFKKGYLGPLDVKVVYLDASVDIRHSRSVSRNRDDAAISLDAFKSKDALQIKMGLDKIRDGSDATILNEGTLESFYKDVMECGEIHDRLKSSSTILAPSVDIVKLEERILVAMSLESSTYRTTTQVASLINSIFKGGRITTNKNNVSRYFNQNRYPYYRVKTEGRKKKYSISSTGISRGLVVIRKHSRSSRI